MYKRIKLEGHARRGEYTTPHGTVQTPVFMNVGTQAAMWTHPADSCAAK